MTARRTITERDISLETKLLSKRVRMGVKEESEKGALQWP